MFIIKNRPAFLAVPAALVAFAAVAGCAKTNPAVGTWTGTTKGGMTANLTLAADGTGTFALPPMMPSRAITWKDGENKQINLSLAPAGGAAAASAGTGGASMPATLSDDAKTMTLTFLMATVTLNKTDAAK